MYTGVPGRSAQRAGVCAVSFFVFAAGVSVRAGLAVGRVPEFLAHACGFLGVWRGFLRRRDALDRQFDFHQRRGERLLSYSPCRISVDTVAGVFHRRLRDCAPVSMGRGTSPPSCPCGDARACELDPRTFSARRPAVEHVGQHADGSIGLGADGIAGRRLRALARGRTVCACARAFRGRTPRSEDSEQAHPLARAGLCGRRCRCGVDVGSALHRFGAKSRWNSGANSSAEHQPAGQA